MPNRRPGLVNDQGNLLGGWLPEAWLNGKLSRPKARKQYSDAVSPSALQPSLPKQREDLLGELTERQTLVRRHKQAIANHRDRIRVIRVLLNTDREGR